MDQFEKQDYVDAFVEKAGSEGGSIGFQEVIDVFRSLGYIEARFPQTVVTAWLTAVDKEANTDCKTDLAEFLRVAEMRTAKERLEARLRRRFPLMDADGSGAVNVEEMRSFVKTDGKHYTDAHILRMRRYLDKDRDGQISLDEFLKVVD